jgi:hypothetical protein
MAPVLEPDPDFRLADSGAAARLKAVSDRILGAVDRVDQAAAGLEESQQGVSVTRGVAELRKLSSELRGSKRSVDAAVTLHEACARAREDFRFRAPTHSDIEAAWAAAQSALVVMAANEDNKSAYAAARDQWKAAMRNYDRLVAERSAAIQAYLSAEAEAKAAYESALREIGGNASRDKSTPDASAPGGAPGGAAAEAPSGSPAGAPAAAPAGAPAVGAPPTGAPAVGAPPAGAPAVGAPPAGAPAPVAAPAAAATTAPSSSGLSPTQAAVLGSALTQPSMAPQMAPQMTQPQMMPAMAPGFGQQPPQQQPRQQDQQSADAAIEDLLRSIAPAAVVPAFAGVGPVSTSPSMTPPPVSAPALTPTFTPTFSTAATPLVSPAAPVVTGSSTPGLVSDANTTGRPDGVPARGAFSPPPGSATHLTGSAAGADPAAGAARGAGVPGAGMPMMPMMPGAMGAPGNGSGRVERDEDRIIRTAEEASLHGLDVVARAVPGGTIAQRRDGNWPPQTAP